jgi:hypothetical protein
MHDSAIKSLNLDGRDLPSAHLEFKQFILSPNIRLEELNITNFSLFARLHLPFLMSILLNLKPEERPVVKLTITNCFFSKDSVRELNQFLQLSSKLNYLDLSGCKVESEAEDIFSIGLKDNTTLQHLDISNSHFAPLATVLPEFIGNPNNPLEYLGLNNACSSKQLEQIAWALKSNKGLKILAYGQVERQIEEVIKENAEGHPTLNELYSTGAYIYDPRYKMLPLAQRLLTTLKQGYKTEEAPSIECVRVLAFYARENNLQTLEKRFSVTDFKKLNNFLNGKNFEIEYFALLEKNEILSIEEAIWKYISELLKPPSTHMIEASGPSWLESIINFFAPSETIIPTSGIDNDTISE